MLGSFSKETFAVLLCGAFFALAVVFQPSSPSKQAALFSTPMSHTAVKTARGALYAQGPLNPGLFNMGNGANAFNPLPGPQGASPFQFLPTLIAGLPSFVLPGVGVLVLIGLLRLFRKPLLRLLGVVEQEEMYAQSLPPLPDGWDMERGNSLKPFDPQAAMDRLLQNSSPDQAQRLQEIRDRLQSQGHFRTQPGLPEEWRREPEAPAPILEESRRPEQARLKALSQAQVGTEEDVCQGTDRWIDRQLRAERAAPVQLDSQQRELTVMSSVLYSFLLARAGVTADQFLSPSK
eukprot:GGOE01055571.1.p1 GENE.GGOE01055571.1~~GGOE01055571.1.p1  ORF type:complete len:300 (-),score=38.60 GGOE01055571.1:277-1149(-)